MQAAALSLLQVLKMILLAGLSVTWWRYYQQAQCWQVIILWLILSAALSLGFFETALMRRQAFLNQYLRQDHPYYQRLRGGIIMLMIQMIKAISLSLWLILAITLLEWQAILVLALDTFLLIAGYQWYQHHFQPFIQAAYVPMISRQYLIRVNTVVITIVLFIMSWWLPHPNYQDLSWNAAVQYEVTHIQTQCPLLGTIIRMMVTIDTLNWWLAQTWLPKIQIPALIWLGWTLFLIGIWVIVWAYSRLLLSGLIQPKTLFNLT